MNKLLTRGGIEFVAVFLGIALSFNVEEWREDAQIKNRLRSDYVNIKKDLEKDLPYLKRIALEQQTANQSSVKMLTMLNPDTPFDYNDFMSLNDKSVANNTFFGTQSSYDASVSSGRLTYFGNDELSNEIGKIYSHHYYRIHYNGELLDNTYFRELPILVTGPLASKKIIRQENTQIIQSHGYITELQLKEEIQRIYVLRCEAGIDQIQKVIKMLDEELSE
ncbi:MAG: hypothetical protein CMG35_10680 [Candidatus Marinimicrobia bacterium]|nr:hypothetical protein [Candidatus Neomarinimicrobiota bacterium]|tara:strand:+ start:3292 stop:3954 length:663 start_codon:yes stop_codon:yes gene_type:complete